MIRRPNYKHISEMEKDIRIYETNMKARREKSSVKVGLHSTLASTKTVVIRESCGSYTSPLFPWDTNDHYAYYNEYVVGSAKPINRVRGGIL